MQIDPVSQTSKLTSIISNHSSKLDSLLDQLDSKLLEVMSKMSPDKKVEFYDKMSKTYKKKLNNMEKSV